MLAPRSRHVGPRQLLYPPARAPQEYPRHPAESYQPRPLHQHPPPTIRSHVGQTPPRDSDARSLNTETHYRPMYRPEPQYLAGNSLRSAPVPHLPQIVTQPHSFNRDPMEAGQHTSPEYRAGRSCNVMRGLHIANCSQESACQDRYNEPPSRIVPTEKEPFDYFRPNPST